jgi:hypothetical protein
MLTPRLALFSNHVLTKHTLKQLAAYPQFDREKQYSLCLSSVQRI